MECVCERFGYVICISPGGPDEPGGESGVESMSLLESRIHFDELESILSNARANIPPPTRNLSGKTHDAGGVGATADGVDDGIRDVSNCVMGSAMKLSMTTTLGRGR